jgi:hypothetical protein
LSQRELKSFWCKFKIKCKFRTKIFVSHTNWFFIDAINVSYLKITTAF